MTVPPSRLERWLAGFVTRHGVTTTLYDDAHEALVTLSGADGSQAFVEVPFPPLVGDLVGHVRRSRTVGVLLARKGGHAAGVFVGGSLVSSKVGSRHVQGRSAAGGWSQQRFARRREGQASVASGAAADVAVRILLAQPLEFVVVGGERSAVDAVLADPRLATLRPLVTGRLLDVPDPRLTVLQSAPWQDVWIRVVDP